MNIPKLSNRLQMVASLVSPCHKIADIGTDHAYIPIFLVKTDCCTHALASDIKVGPAEKASINVGKYGLLEQIEVAVAAGLDAVDFDTTQQIIIAGMGGEIICEILRAAHEHIQSHILILQPQTDLPLVRHFLFENGYEIQKELVTTEAHRVYNALRTVKSTVQTESTLKNCEIGAIIGTFSAIFAYKNKLLKKLTTEKNGLIRGGFEDCQRIQIIDLIIKELQKT